MRQRMTLLVGLSLAVMTQGHAEVSADGIASSDGNRSERAQDEGSLGQGGFPVQGSLDQIDRDGKRIVVSDQVRVLSETMMIDGEQRLAHQVLDRLEVGMEVQIRQYKPSRSQPPVVTEIVTDVESIR